MKQRISFVSNSSSSSFLVPFDAFEKFNVHCVKLSDEIVESLKKNLVDFDGNHVDMSKHNEWWLTEMISDCYDAYGKISDADGAIDYLQGNDAPYGWYDDGGEKRYICLHGGQDCDFYIAIGDMIGNESNYGSMPRLIEAKLKIEKILKSKSLNKTQKLYAIEDYISNL